jgi:thiol-disulfide isomerase/thioredoxin
VVSGQEEDGTYWCPDCEILKPLFPIFEQDAKAASLPFYIFVAGDMPTWMDPENKLRKHKALLVY